MKWKIHDFVYEIRTEKELHKLEVKQMNQLIKDVYEIEVLFQSLIMNR